MLSENFMNKMEALQHRIGRNGEEHLIYLPYDRELKDQAKREGARWDSERNTYLYQSDDEDHPLAKYQYQNWITISFPNGMEYEDRKEATTDIKNETPFTCSTKCDGKWTQKILVCDDTKELITQLTKPGLIQEGEA